MPVELVLDLLGVSQELQQTLDWLLYNEPRILLISSFPFCWFDMHRPLSWGPPVQKYRLPTQMYKYSTIEGLINQPHWFKCSTIEVSINQPHWYTCSTIEVSIYQPPCYKWSTIEVSINQLHWYNKLFCKFLQRRFHGCHWYTTLFQVTWLGNYKNIVEMVKKKF
jgi:hypothetical protein